MISFGLQLPSEAPYGRMINELEVGNEVEGRHHFPVCRIIAIFSHAKRPVTFFEDLLAVHLSIISVTDQLNAPILVL